MSTVESKDGTSIAFDRSGRGPAVILAAPAFGTRADQASLAAALAPFFTVCAYDRRGRGESGDTAPYAVEREIEDLEAVIDAAGGAAHVFGHSSGAVLALDAARVLPAKITKLAPTLPYDATIMADTQRGDPSPLQQWAAVAVPTLVMDGTVMMGREDLHTFMRYGADALADVLPNAQRRTLEGQDHGPAEAALVPALKALFLG